MDYRDVDKPQRKEPDPRAPRWFRSERDAEIAQGVTTDLDAMRRQQQQRITQYVVSTRLYGNLPALPFGGVTVMQLRDKVRAALSGVTTFNVVGSVVDTLVSKIAKNRPRPLFLTSGGDYRQQRKAKGLTKFVDGVFYENDADRMMPNAMRDASVYGDGLVAVFERNDRVAWERTLAVELWADELEGYYGAPRNLHRVKDVDRDVLAEWFPDSRRKIMEARPAFDTSTNTVVSDMVTVRESWHLPSGKGADDGMHVISIDNHVLTPKDQREWDNEWFPFARLPYKPRLYGFWAAGLAEELQSIQIDINGALRTISESHRLGGSYKILLERGSKVVKEHVNNAIGTLLEYTGTKPDYITPPMVQAEIYAWVDAQIQKAYEQAGVSQMSANSVKPAGLDSGKALREFNDIEADRFTTTGQNYEAFACDLARLSIATVKQIAKRGKYKVAAPARGRTVEVEWSEVKLESDAYVMKCFPVSALPRDPAGRLQTVQEYAQAGYLSPPQARRLLAFPDIEADDSLATAMEDHLTDVIERMAYDGKAYQPEPYDDLETARELALETYARGQTNGLPPENMALLRGFMAQIDALAKPPAPAGGAPALGVPQAVPEAAPQSDLLPNAPAAPGVM